MKYIQNIQDTIAAKDTTTVRPEDLQLKPLYEPADVPFTVETIGWKLLAIFLVLLGLTILYFVIKHHKKNAYRREALKELEQVHSVSEILVILKIAAMKAFGREQTGALYGESWITFLDEKVKTPLFAPHKESIAAVVYQENEPSEETKRKIITNSKKWIKTHAR
ncbi:DUF4381 domain-containing protein [Galbibacter mesophilus]|uniref:DUF4381 domain-containing protein n=1 Tax=Galbibacter mesophilus TaxID=379069 RepID=UPI00191E76A4|nr:DUF4381 domain-containing protein [Galbibacter mesophilus]MCM5664113.1 DUF4381 domain-containing protein [Galbibacter mesophilus]